MIIKRLFILPFLFFVLLSCDSDTNDVTEPEVVIPEDATIESFSENFAYSGENVEIIGTNFTSNKSDVTLTFEGVSAEIISTSNTKIVVNLPEVNSLTPDFNLQIKNRNITNNVQNDYEGKIGILPYKTNEWVKSENRLNISRGIFAVQLVNRESSYISLNDNGGGGNVYRTLDGGITWERWAGVGFDGNFYATNNDNGWVDLIGLRKISSGGESAEELNIGTTNSFCGLFVDDELKNGVVVTQKNEVYETQDGINFSKIYDDSTSDSYTRTSFMIDKNHFWALGRSPSGSSIEYPYILYKNTEGNILKKYFFTEEPNKFIPIVSFPDVNNGFAAIGDTTESSLYKTSNGGDEWTKVTNLVKPFYSLVFINANVGYATYEKNIYKTIDAGVTWNIDYTHDENVGALQFDGSNIWAVSRNSVLKYFID